MTKKIFLLLAGSLFCNNLFSAAAPAKGVSMREAQLALIALAIKAIEGKSETNPNFINERPMAKCSTSKKPKIAKSAKIKKDRNKFPYNDRRK